MIINFYFIDIGRPLETVLEDLAAAAELGCDSVELGSVLGSCTDPLTHLHIADIIQRAVESGMRRIMFRTDLHISLTKQDIHDLYYLGVFFFRVPLFGYNEKTHRSILPIPTSLETTLAGIQRLRAMHIPKVQQSPFIIIEVPVYQGNTGHLLETIQLAIEQQVDTVSLRFLDDAVRYTGIMREIDTVFETAIAAKTWVELIGPPVCVRKERRFFFRDYYVDCVARNHTAKLESCTHCMFDEICCGIRETYLKIQGEGEFAPITAIE